ncbi:hypothetical protein [Glycomyces paridis]|uniref:Uncharacterized protein n=1 Tax=Glycomyces paridis TaxID=2126555 RepID=A0A4S8PCE7_9ACTN|nr:hypothetical protein [Glycomyces paridis]THV25964.1 hypothetical protein E9998_19720 [Glycomyces paridis]
MTTPDRVTITIPVPAAVHLAIGVTMTLIGAAAWWVHFALPIGHAYKNTASDIGLLAGFVTLAYWIVCVIRGGRTENRTAIAEAVAREERLVGALRDISGEVAENRTAIKDLNDTVADLNGAVEALQDTYLNEGKP